MDDSCVIAAYLVSKTTSESQRKRRIGIKKGRPRGDVPHIDLGQATSHKTQNTSHIIHSDTRSRGFRDYFRSDPNPT